MNRSSLIIAGAAAALAVTVVVLFRREETPPAEVPVQAQATPETAPETAAPMPENIPTPLAAALRPALPAPPAEPQPEDLSEYTEIKFRADENGRMVANERARLNLEKLFALYTPTERQKKLEELQATLPPAAARDLADMLERYINYDAAQAQIFPPADLNSPEDGFNLLDGTHNLRVQYFGAEAANSMFGQEEKMQRELLRLMNLDKDESLTMEERAERAQQMYQNQMPVTVAELAVGRKQAEQIEAARRKQSPPKAD